MQGVGNLDSQALSEFVQRTEGAVKGIFNAETSSGMIVAATRDWPGDLNEFPANGKIIGIICVSFHLVRFRLRPGIYTIRLYRTRFGTWQAEFLNESDQSVNYMPVTITETRESYEIPRAFISFSSPGVIICWDNT
jgi:hypothetical protein